MLYAKIKDGAISKYPYNRQLLKMENRNTSFPVDSLERSDIRDSYGIVEVVATEQPSKPGWKVAEEEPSFSGGVWSQNWKLVIKDVSEVNPSEIEPVEMPVQEGYEAEEGNPALDGDIWKQTWNLVERSWLQNRIFDYGSVSSQIEFITENGLEAWQAKVAEIKAKYPKV